MSTKLTFRLTDEQLADTLMQVIIKRTGVEAEAAEYEWETKGKITYFDRHNRHPASKDPNVAVLVNAYNVLKFGEVKRFK